jgi:hypothetical protein
MTNPDKPTAARDRGLGALALFVVPLVVLLGIRSFGLWREREAGTVEQNRQLTWQAQTAAETAAAILDKERLAWAWAQARVAADGRLTGSAWFRQDPLPEPESTASAAMAAGRWQDVIANHPGELSPTGLPLGPVAAFHILQEAPDDGAALDAARTLRELAFAFPSILSQELLEAVDLELTRRGLIESAGEPWQPRWQEVSEVAAGLETLIQNGLPAAGESVLTLDGEAWWVEVRQEGDGQLLRIFPLAKVVEATRATNKRGSSIGFSVAERCWIEARAVPASDWPWHAISRKCTAAH